MRFSSCFVRPQYVRVLLFLTLMHSMPHLQALLTSERFLRDGALSNLPDYKIYSPNVKQAGALI